MPDIKRQTTLSGQQIRKALEERDELIFRTVCEDLCKNNDQTIGEEAKWEKYCKNCPLWKLL